jgi:hypothetical protein
MFALLTQLRQICTSPLPPPPTDSIWCGIRNPLQLIEYAKEAYRYTGRYAWSQTCRQQGPSTYANAHLPGFAKSI